MFNTVVIYLFYERHILYPTLAHWSLNFPHRTFIQANRWSDVIKWEINYKHEFTWWFMTHNCHRTQHNYKSNSPVDTQPKVDANSSFITFSAKFSFMTMLLRLCYSLGWRSHDVPCSYLWQIFNANFQALDIFIKNNILNCKSLQSYTA